MWTIEAIVKAVRGPEVLVERWGLNGESAARRIEQNLSRALGPQLRRFVLDLGNLRIGAFDVVVGGDLQGTYSAVTETKTLWQEFPQLEGLGLIQIMDFAEERYLYECLGETVNSYDCRRPFAGEEIQRWENFDTFMRWLMKSV